MDHRGCPSFVYPEFTYFREVDVSRPENKCTMYFSVIQ